MLPRDQQARRAGLIYPVTDAVTAAVLICPPPEPFGTLKRIEPLFKLMVRVPPLKLKIVCEPRRVIVISCKVSSVPDSTPVRTAVSSRTRSLTEAGRGAAFDGNKRTS